MKAFCTNFRGQKGDFALGFVVGMRFSRGSIIKAIHGSPCSEVQMRGIEERSEAPDTLVYPP